MFSFFSKKEFLVDHLNGFIDIHNHILPGIDDGAKTAKESIGLIHGFQEFGVSRFICTPHIMHNYYDNTPETIQEAYNKLQKKLNKEGLSKIKIDYAAEHMIDDNFENILEKNTILPIRKEYILVEMSYLQPSINFDTSIEKIKKHGLYPIFSHPERYIYLQNSFDSYKRFKDNGILFQMNLLSLSGYYGKSIQKNCYKLLDNKLFNFAATDIHNIRHLNSLKNTSISKKTLNQVLPILDNTILHFY